MLLHTLLMYVHAAVCLAAHRWRRQWPGTPAVPYNASITCLPVQRQAVADSGTGISALLFRGRRS